MLTLNHLHDVAAWALRICLYGTMRGRDGAYLYPWENRAAHAIALELMALEAEHPNTLTP